MIGVSDLAMVFSWLLTYLVLFLVTCALIVAVTSSSLFQYSNLFLVFLLYYLFCVCVFSFSYLVSTCFDRARVGSTFGAIFFLCSFFAYFAINDPSTPSATKGLACLSPSICFAQASVNAATMESTGVGVTMGNMYEAVDNFAFGSAVWWMIFDAVFFFLVAMYLEQVR